MYLVIKEAFNPVLEEINNLIAAGKVLVDGSEVPLQFVFGYDYKVTSILKNFEKIK